MKLKRLLTGVLSAVMALSVCAMPALAAAADTTSTSTINTSLKGSITIYKYAQTKDQEDASKTNGNGEAIEDSSTIQGTPLPDAEFTLYRVKNADELVAYYNGLQNASATEFTVSNCFKDGEAHVAKNLKKEYTSNTNNDDKALGVVDTQTTKKDGVAVFNQLPVGLYLVIETRKPDSVTKAVEPFLVSIPMTREATDTKGTEWLYNVTVYPKNSTVKGNVTLIKYGSNGTDTITLAGVKFKLYKYDGLEHKYIDVTPTGGIATEFNGQVTLSELVKGRYVLQEIGYADSKDKNKGYILNTTGIYAFSIDDKGEVAANGDTTFEGVTGEKVTKDDDFKLENDTTNGATISITNYKPDFEKNVTKRDEASPAGNTTHDADYGVGENVPYTLTIKVPENVAKLQTFKVTDTALASQLKQNPDSIVVKGIAKGDDATEVRLTKDTDYTASVTEKDGNSVMEVDFKSKNVTKIADYAGGTITITYTSKLQDGAVIADANNSGNFNTADLIYSRTTNTSSSESPDDNKPYQIEDTGVVYSYALNIKKTAQGGKKDGEALEKVTFDLYKKATKTDLATHKNETDEYTFRGQPCKAISKADAAKLGLPTDDNQVWLKVGTLETDSKGEANASGLPAGDYKMVETKTADGYNLLSAPVDAKLNLEYKTKWNDTGTYENGGKEIKRTYNETTYTYNDNQGTAVPGTALNIVNRAGFTLPVTGGFGTLLFSGIGVLLVLAGVCVLFSMKKKNNRA